MHSVLLCDPKELGAGHLGQLTVAITSKNSNTEKCNTWSYRLWVWHYLTGLLLHSARRIPVVYLVLTVLRLFFLPNFFQSRYFLSSTYHFFLPLAAVTAATSTAYPPRHLLLCVSGTDTDHLHQTDLQSHHHATQSGHLSTKMSTSKRFWCHADVWQAVLTFIWLVSMRSSGADPPHQAAAGCLPEDTRPITLGPALLRTTKHLGPGVQVKRRWVEFLLWTHMLFSHQHPKLHEILDGLHLTLFFLKPWLILPILFSFFFTPTYFLNLMHFKLSHLRSFFQSAGCPPLQDHSTA